MNRPEPAGPAAAADTPIDPATALDVLLAVDPDPTAPDHFIGAARDYGPLRVYGGHFLGQALAAAFRTVPEPRLAHSLHAYFLRTGNPAVPIRYAVERLRDGGSYVTRNVRAIQQDQTVFQLTASFKDPEAGDTHQPDAPDAPPAETLAARRRRAGHERPALPFTLGTGLEVEITDDWAPWTPRRDTAGIRLWMRMQLEATHDPRLQQCALAFASDSTLLFNALRRHGQTLVTHRTTSLDHAMWFYGLPACQDWLLYDQSGPAAADGRGFNQGFIYATDGRLCAAVAQEGMMRRT